MTITLKNGAEHLHALLPKLPHAQQTWHCFETPEAACAYLKSVPPEQHWYFSERTLAIRDDEFYGNASLDDAIELCRQGWPEGADRVARLRDKINAQRPHGRRLARWDVAGAYPSVPRALAGNPLNMRRIDSAKLRRRPVITLVNHMGGLADVAADTFVNKCAVVAALVDAIEAAGFACHVIGLSVSQGSSNYACGFVTTVKEPNQSVDVGRLAFALGHVAMFRRIVFATRSSDPRNRNGLGRSMGSTRDFPENVPDVYVLPSMNANKKYFHTEELAATQGLDHYIAELQKQNCPAFPH